MKKSLSLLMLLTYVALFSQKKYFILFNPQRDKIVYIKHKNKIAIDGIKIFVGNNKYIYFISADKKSDYKSSKIPYLKTITREELNRIIEKDNPQKTHKFIIIKKDNNIYYYYFMDHIFRTISD